MDPLLLARAQFAANITFHILFPSITIALGWLLMFFRWRWLRTQDGAWLAAYRFWTKVFALTFALGVVSGITMSFQFGTNWPGYMETVGNIAGPLLAYEVLTAFFLEAGFLGVMLFGHGRVSERIHMMASFFVAFGTTVSAFWILALNSWMQTPAGHEVIDGVFHVKSWAEVVFNPSFPYHLTHVLVACALTCAFLLSGLSTWQLLRGKAQSSAPKVLRVGLALARAGDAAANLRWRPARPEHAEGPAGEGGHHGRCVGHRARRTPAAGIRLTLASVLVRKELCWLPFVLLIAVFMQGFVGLAYSIYPYVVIDQLTVWEAASSPAALKVILIGVCISVPAIAAYAVFSYRVFWGKATELRYV